MHCAALVVPAKNQLTGGRAGTDPLFSEAFGLVQSQSRSALSYSALQPGLSTGDDRTQRQIRLRAYQQIRTPVHEQQQPAH